jgi:hypothetical protein
MFDFATEEGSSDDVDMQMHNQDSLSIPELEVLMFALPHHQERLRPTAKSSNAVKDVGCQASLHGIACPVSTLLPRVVLVTCPFQHPNLRENGVVEVYFTTELFCLSP